MKQKKLKQGLIGCAVLFAVALVLSAVFSGDAVEGWNSTRTGHVVLSEILASNRTYPAPNGQYLDFIEVRNLSATPTDISGYMLSDDTSSIGYTFPEGTVLPAHGYAVCWCDKESTTGQYASFGISKGGGDTVYLYNSANVLVDEKEVPPTVTNTSLIRCDDGTWVTSVQATPGYENTDAGFQAWLQTVSTENIQVVITEIMTGNSCTALGESRHLCDWVELTNTGSSPAVLSGCYLTNDPADPLKWPLLGLRLAPGERTVIHCAGAKAETGEAPFGLARSGCTLVLTGSHGNILSQVTCPALETDWSWALTDSGAYEMTDLVTPGFGNDAAGYQAWLQSIGADSVQVTITEIMASNHSTVTNAAGQLCDWVELTNTGTAAADLTGGYLSDDPEQRGKWQIPSLTLSPGQRVVIPCSGSLAVQGEADFSLPARGGTVVLTGPSGNILSKVTYGPLGDDRVWALTANGTYEESLMPSPGFENTEAGCLAYRAAQAPSGGLGISEVMPSNSKYLQQSDGGYYDWIELRNASADTIDLSDYCLSNDPSQLSLFPLPQRKLAPGQRIVVICSGNDQLIGNRIQAPFTLSRAESWVYISDAKGRLCDSMHIYDVPYGGSVGRVSGDNRTYYFTTPTPGAPNGTGVAFVSGTPKVLTQAGVYNDVTSLSVAIEGPGELYYTLDGSSPTQRDNRYTGPIALSSTAVLRVVSIEKGKLPSDVVTASFFLNENHTLPVVSLSADPDSLLGDDGIYQKYTHDVELPCNVQLFEQNGSFSIDCGVKMFGSTSLSLPKKSFKLNFRGSYGAPVLGYGLYGEDAPYVYDSLILRAGQDQSQAIFRDELFSQLAIQLGSHALTQRHKFCILYINGEYWGIYSLKEAFGETYYAQNKEVSQESVSILQSPAASCPELQALLDAGAAKDMALAESYDAMAAQMDLDSLTDWMILQGYSCNTDIGQNLRLFRSSENGSKWQFALYDLDYGFYYPQPFTNLFSSSETEGYAQLTRSMIRSSAFRQQFLQRLSQARSGALRDENVLAQIDAMEKLLAPEVARERARWGGTYEGWTKDVQRLRDFLAGGAHWNQIADNVRSFLRLTPEEMQTYFGRGST